jgi:pimeloyl-ACP methyl ester carboxylesterase
MGGQFIQPQAPEPQIADTALGPVQFATVGEGTPVLIVHGTPGGYDQADVMARFLPRGEFKAILLSRPGYLGTPLGTLTSIDEQADLLAALLDHLGIDKVGVLSWSGGGPSSFRFAVRHPERITALVALAPATLSLVRPHDDLPTRLMFSTRAGEWLLRVLSAHAPKPLISGTLASEGDLSKEQVIERTNEVFADDEKRSFVLGLDATVTHRGRQEGLDNDWAQFEAMPALELERISAPTLVVQGAADSDVTPDHGQAAAAAIPGAELLMLEAGTHLAFYTHPDAARAQDRAIALLRGGASPSAGQA